METTEGILGTRHHQYGTRIENNRAVCKCLWKITWGHPENLGRRAEFSRVWGPLFKEVWARASYWHLNCYCNNNSISTCKYYFFSFKISVSLGLIEPGWFFSLRSCWTIGLLPWCEPEVMTKVQHWFFSSLGQSIILGGFSNRKK